MHPILFKIDGFSFYTHGLLAVLGIIAGSATIYFLAQRARLKTEYLFDNTVYTVLAGIVGARLTYFFLYRDQFSSIKEIFFLWNGGLVSYGGFLLGGLTIFLLLRSQKENMWRWLDLYSIGFAVGLALGRIGNIFAGEYDGIATASKFAISGLIPVTLYESILLFVLFGILLTLYLSRKISEKAGTAFALLLAGYGLGRFIIDFWRAEKLLFWDITLGQVVSLLVMLAGLFLLFNINRIKRKEKI
ncbi:MAG: prolipoprotein diacylglyceryl transferase [Candidatus Berkelbacteria bacterium]|nr:prolipoprotein diacylglyceryl transferase [Candidatus Berkelbacteria bacterium]